MIIVQIAGRLGRDPESRFTPSGQKVTTLTVACNVRKAGKEETVWWRVTIWGDRFDKMLPYLKKGSAVIVVGEMGKPDIWTDKEGRPQVSMELTAEIVRFSPFSSGEKDGRIKIKVKAKITSVAIHRQMILEALKDMAISKPHKEQPADILRPPTLKKKSHFHFN